MRAAIVIITLLSLSGCAAVQAASPTTLQSFGFALVDCGFDDPRDASESTDYLDEVAPFTNIAQLCVFAPEERVADRLNRMGALGVKAMLSVQDLFFTGTADLSTGSGERFTLRLDFEQRWLSFVQTNSLVDHTDEIFAFYIADEPTWNGISGKDLDVVAQLVKATVPGAATALIEAWPAIGQLEVPSSIDLIGFDHYGVADPGSDAGYLAELEDLKSKRSSATQKIIVVLDSQWVPAYGEAAVEPVAMASVAENYFAFASADPDVVALVGYVWPSGLDDPAQLGARALPQSVRDTYVDIGARITGK